jgi:hypothetical protein
MMTAAVTGVFNKGPAPSFAAIPHNSVPSGSAITLENLMGKEVYQKQFHGWLERKAKAIANTDAATSVLSHADIEKKFVYDTLSKGTEEAKKLREAFAEAHAVKIIRPIVESGAWKSYENLANKMHEAQGLAEVNRGLFLSSSAEKAHALENAAAPIRKMEKLVGSGIVGLGAIDVAKELIKYPSWRRGAIAEASKINGQMAAIARRKQLLTRAGILGGIGVAGAVGAGVLYNKMHDPIDPLVLPTISNPLSGLFGKAKAHVAKTKLTAHPNGKIEIEETHVPQALPMPQAPAPALPQMMSSPEPEMLDDHDIPEWMKKSAYDAPAEHVAETIGDHLRGVKAGVKGAWHNTPWWYKDLGVAGTAGAGYLLHDAVKTHGAGETLASLSPGLHKNMQVLRHQADGAVPGGLGAHHPHAPMATWKKVAIGGAGVLGAGYLYNKMNPEKPEEGGYKAANLSPMPLSNAYLPAQASAAGRGLLGHGAGLIGAGLAAGLALPVLGRGIANAYNMYQQNKIQRDMLAIQQLQAAQQMQMGGMGMALGGGYTNPVAMQQSTLY